jgi:hypothetical protein
MVVTVSQRGGVLFQFICGPIKEPWQVRVLEISSLIEHGMLLPGLHDGLISWMRVGRRAIKLYWFIEQVWRQKSVVSASWGKMPVNDQLHPHCVKALFGGRHEYTESQSHRVTGLWAMLELLLVVTVF